MGWFGYSVALPSGLFRIGFGACVLYWLIKQGASKGVAKPDGLVIEKGSVSPNSPSTEAASR